ncbi:S-protein homolog 6-like [Cannabis sativa]|uniref:S-protein homolog 6-like n=1 Tax=Cannabis sativa TaxID=3483 RepID=UPI0029CA2A1E|nr:S-protein homolog 6-like [Cannabis sativa]
MEKALICSVLLMMMVNMISSSSSSIVLSNNNDNNNNYDEKTGGVFVYKTTVKIFNNLKDGVQLTVHCKSADDDLGAHVVANNGEYEFKFRINFAGTTLYNCGLTWIGATGSFDLFKASRDSLRCANTCVWRAHNDGVYGFKEDSTKPDIIYKWA